MLSATGFRRAYRESHKELKTLEEVFLAELFNVWNME